MKTIASRAVLAFYSSEEEQQAKRAHQALHSSGSSPCIVRGDSGHPPEWCRLYSELRIEGETLIALETEPSKIGHVVKTLRHEGTPSIFVVRPNAPAGQRKKPAKEKKSYTAPRTRREILARLDVEKKLLDAARRDLREAARLDHALPPAAEWILDNSYLIRTQIAQVRQHLPRNLERWIAAGPPEAGVPSLARELVKQCSYSVNADNIKEFLRQRQIAGPLTIAELWAFPLFLRIALIEELTAIAARVAQAQQLREVAYLWANRLASAARVSDEAFAHALTLLETEPVALEPHFVAALAEQLQDEEQALGPLQRWIEKHFQSPITDLARDLHTREAAQTVSTANAFGSLRTLGGLSFTTIFEDVSLVEAELRCDPAGVYPKSDFSTRDRCRRALERMARQSRLPELDVARAAVRLTRENGRHVAFYLLADGLLQLEKATGARVPLAVHAARGRLPQLPRPFTLRPCSGLTHLFHRAGRNFRN